MGNFIDLTGKKFNRLLVLYLDYMHEKRGAYWLCKCDCGKEKSIWGASLKNSSILSCGCLNVEKTSKRQKGKIINLVGRRFGKLTVLKLNGRSNKRTLWLCKCDCGNQIEVVGGSLTSNHTKSCGCYHRERVRELKLDKLENKKFGMLTVLEIDNSEHNERTAWICLCDCGNILSVISRDLKNGNTKSCGCLRESLVARELKKYFVTYYNAEVEKRTIKNPDTSQWLKCDIYLPNENVYIEVNGEQHYKINAWHKRMAKTNNTTPEEEFEYQKKKDRMKRKYARKNGTYIEINLIKIKSFSSALGFINRKLTREEAY